MLHSKGRKCRFHAKQEIEYQRPFPFPFCSLLLVRENINVPSPFPFVLYCWSVCSLGAVGPINLSLEEDTSEVFNDIQQIWIQMPRSGIAVAIVYVPPGDLAGRQEQLLTIADFCEIAESLELRPIIMGDLNIHDLEKVRVDHLDPNMRQEHTFINNMCRLNSLKVVKNESGKCGPTRIPERGQRFQKPSTLDYIIVDEQLQAADLHVDGERKYSLPSDHIMIHTYIKYGGMKEREMVDVGGEIEGWSRRKLRDDELIHQYTTYMEDIWDNVYDGQGSIQQKYDVMVENIRQGGKMRFSFVHREKRDIIFPPQLIRFKSTIRKVRKEIRRLRRLQLPVGEINRKLWRLRKQLKNFISKRYERKMMVISEQLNRLGGRAIQYFYDYIKNKKTPPQQKMLLRG